MTRAKMILKAKNQVAVELGYEADVMGNPWEYAMRLTYRTRKQIIMYEKVIDLIAGGLEAVLYKDNK